MKAQRLLANVRAANGEVAEAEDALAALLRKLRPTARAEKTTISKAFEAAFDRLRTARQHLRTLERLASGEDK
jgi:hypothetical protein